MKIVLGLISFLIVSLNVGCGHLGQSRASKAFEIERSWARNTLARDYLGYRLNHVAEPVLYGNLVILANEIDGIVAYKKKSGHLAWRRDISGGVASPLRLQGDRIYFGGGDGFYHAISAKNGDSLWSFPVSAEGIGAPLIEKGVVYFQSGAGVVYALKADSGEQIWIYSRTDTAPLTVRGASEPSLHGNRLLVGFSDGSLAALSKDSGNVIWEISLGEGPRFKDVDAKPVIDGNRAYVSSYDGRLYAIDAGSGNILWSHDEGGFLPVTVSDDKVVYATSSRKVVALDRKSGKMLWTRDLNHTVSSQPVIYRGLVLFSEWSGDLRAVDIRNGQDVTRYSTGRGVTSKPVIDADRDMIYVMTKDANVFALKLAFRHPNEQWPWERTTP